MKVTTVTPETASQILEEWVKEIIQNPDKVLPAIMVFGKPGIGKTSIVHQVANEYGLKVLTFLLSLRDPTDLFGSKIPEKVGDTWRTFLSVPTVISEAMKAYEETQKPLVILFDEFNHATPMTLKGLFQLLLERRMESFVLPPCIIVLCGNRDYESLGWSLEEFPAAFWDRVIKMEMVFSLKQWIEWAIKNDVDPRIIGFLKWKPEIIDPQPDGSIITPRTLVRASDILKMVGDKKMWILRTILGDAGFNSFETWMKVISKIDLLKILEDPSQIKGLSDEQKLGFIISLVSYLKNGTDKEFQKSSEAFFQIDEKEYQVFIIQMIKPFCSWLVKNEKRRFDKVLKSMGDLLGLES